MNYPKKVEMKSRSRASRSFRGWSLGPDTLPKRWGAAQGLPASLTGHIIFLQSQNQGGDRTTASHGDTCSTDAVTATQQSVLGWSPGEAPGHPRPLPSAPLQPTHPVLVEVVSLHTGPLEAELALAAARAVCPGEVARLAHHLTLGLARAPQLGAGLHVGAGLGAHTKGQLTLLAQRVAGARQVLRQGDGLAGLVQEAVSCGSRGCSSGTGPERQPWPARGLEGRERMKPGTQNGPHQSLAPRVESEVGNRRQMGRAARLPRPRSPCPLSRKSVTMAALQADQGLARSIWMSVGDIIWLPRSFPNTSSHTFTLSWGMLNTWPAGEMSGLRGGHGMGDPRGRPTQKR